MRFQSIAGVVVVIIVFLGAASLLLPGLGPHREASRRMQCGNNVKQLCLGLQNYHDTFLDLPAGAENRPMDEEFKKISWGKSWIVATLPFCEQKPLYDKMLEAEKTRAGSCFTSEEVRSVVADKFIMYLVCPTSPLPEWQTLMAGKLVVPSYAGIMGANDEPGEGEKSLVDKRIVGGPYGGRAAGNGMLPINDFLTFAACTDGTANAIIVGEVSDWYYDDAGQQRNPALSVANAGDGEFDEQAGWPAGNNLRFVAGDSKKVPLVVTQNGPAIISNSVCNLITIDQAVGTNNRDGKSDTHPNWGTKGIGRCGFNNPLSSAHSGGAMVGFLDGHVVLLKRQTSTLVLKQLAIRDDGGIIPCD
jgi:prepilin-type processing-associated H-X9-DG protein